MRARRNDGVHRLLALAFIRDYGLWQELHLTAKRVMGLNRRIESCSKEPSVQISFSFGIFWLLARGGIDMIWRSARCPSHIRT